MKGEHCPLTLLGGKHEAKEKRREDLFTDRWRLLHTAVFLHTLPSRQSQVFMNVNLKSW